jgi:RNA-directed DNA polymerase
MERRRVTKVNTKQTPESRTQFREIEEIGLERVRQRSKSHPKERMTALMHHLTVSALWQSYDGLKRRAALGVDGVTWQDYGENLVDRLTELHERIQSNRYRPQPSRRVYIAKADGQQRPPGIAALEEKIVQGAVVQMHNAIYEPAFMGCSYGFRPRYGPHDALDALAYGVRWKPVSWIVDVGITRFFDTMNHEWLVHFMEHRIGDRLLLWLIVLWLKAGVMEKERISVSEEGTTQGAVISPVLANS